MKFRFTIVMSLSAFLVMQAHAQVTQQGVQSSFENYIKATTLNGSINNGSALPTFLIKQDTKGNRYLYESWVGGSVTGTDGVVYNSPKYKYNYDKISRKLFMQLDSATVIELSSGDIAGFTLNGDEGELRFERMKNSTDLNFYQAVYKNEKGYSLYKLLNTKFKKADFQTNGIVESGNKFDEYVDEEQYFIVSPKHEMMRVIFKKKNIEKILENESEKVKAYFSLHKNDAVDETFVKNLVQSLNTQP